MNPAAHRDVLDSFGGCKNELSQVKECWGAYRQASRIVQEAEQNIARAKSEEDDLRHWVAELEKIAPVEDEEEKLSQRRNELMNAEKLIWRTSGIKGNTSSFTNYDIMTSKNSYTKAEVDSLIASAGFGGTVDLTNYVTKTDFEELEDTVGNI